MRIQRPNTPAVPRTNNPRVSPQAPRGAGPKPRGAAPQSAVPAPNPGMAAAAGGPKPRGAGGKPAPTRGNFNKGGMVKKSNCGASVPPSKKR
jgi:hypothetical protein